MPLASLPDRPPLVIPAPSADRGATTTPTALSLAPQEDPAP